MARVLMGPVAGIVAAWALLVGVCGADPGDARLTPGDKVEIEWVGRRVEAEFVEYSITGWITVKFFSNGIEHSPTFPPDKVRALGGGKNAKGPKRPLRTWTDTTGTFKTKARFVALEGDELTLETEDGKQITLALEKLSAADQAMARKIAAKVGPTASKADAKGDNPFAAKPAPPTRPRSQPEPADEPNDEPADDAPEPVEVAMGEWRRCRTITVDPPADWSVPVDGGVFPEKLASAPIPLPGPPQGSDGFFEKIDGLHMARGGAKACAVIRNSPPTRAVTTTLSFIDLVGGKVEAPVRLPSRTNLVDVDRTGEFVLTVPDTTLVLGTTGPPPPPLGVWKVAGDSLEPVRVWNPQDPNNIHKDTPSFARFIDADHVVCVNFPNKLSVWNVPEARAIWTIELANGSEPVVSPGGKYVAAAVGDRICLFDALTGKTAGCLQNVPGAIGTLSFRPDGGQCAVVSPQRVVVWDLQTGKVYRDIAFSNYVPTGSVDWLYGGYLLCGGSSLIDLERRIVIWKYLSDSAGGEPGGWGEFGGQFWYALQAKGSQGRALYPAVLPHDDVRRVAAGLDPEQLLAVRPGAAFTLDVRVQGDAAEQQQVQQALTARLQAAGMTVGQGAALVLQATTETGKSREMSYRAFGRPLGEAEKVTITEQISRLKILEQGKPVWEGALFGGGPAFLEIKKGQTIQDALAPYQKPNLKYFSSVNLPRYVARTAEAGAYGFSRYTPQGIVNIEPPAPAAVQAR